jgi:hypothetical protein
VCEECILAVVETLVGRDAEAAIAAAAERAVLG